MMRKTGFMLVVTALTALGMAGCASKTATQIVYPHSTLANMTQSPHEHYQSVSSIAAQDRRALVDDLDVFFMTDRPTRLTRWRGAPHWAYSGHVDWRRPSSRSEKAGEISEIE